MEKTNILVYGVIAVVVAVVVGFAASMLLPNSASIKLSLYTTNNTAVYPYQTSYFYMLVNNTGSAQLNNLLVGFYLNGANLKYYTVTIPGHSHVLLGANYTYTVNGTYSFQATADPTHVFSISNRSTTQQSVNIKVLQTQTPNVYTSIPNNNIVGTQSFTFSSAGTLSTAAITDKYNISSLNNMFYPQSIVPKIFENLYAYIALTNGAYVHYSNNTNAYTAWAQGTITPVLVNYVLASYHLPQNTISVNGTKIYVTTINNQTSVCTFYQKGWTKIISYYNNSLKGTCAGVSASSYNPIESNVLVTALKGNTTLTHYQSGFAYTNSTQIGTAVTYGSNSLSGMNIFQNNFGFFISSVRQYGPPANVLNSTGKCLGLIADSNATHICTIYITPRTGSLPANFSLVNTTMLAPTFSFNLYSLIAVRNLFSAHSNGAALLQALKVNQTTQRWSTGFANTCAMFNASLSLGCSIANFNYSSNAANVTFANNLASAIKVNSAACYEPGVQHYLIVNKTIAASGKGSFIVPCYTIPVPVVAAVTSYNFTVNYTINGKTKLANGLINVTNFGS